MQLGRPITNPDATSPYQRRGKHPYKYAAWVTEARDPPFAIQQELAAARTYAALQNAPARQRAAR